MRRLFAGFFIFFTAMVLSSSILADVDSLNRPSTHGNIHVLPRAAVRQKLSVQRAKTSVLRYGRGPVMTGTVNIYAIYWTPATLQDGSVLNMNPNYIKLQSQILSDFAGHGLASNLTQYYQIKAGETTYVSGLTQLTGSYHDTNPFPQSSDCQAMSQTGNCFSDQDLTDELQNFMAANDLKGGLNNVYIVFAPKGEEVCDGQYCNTDVNNGFCGYHSFIDAQSSNDGLPLIYSIIPYGDPACFVSGVSPNKNPDAESAMTTLIHEVSEAITNPDTQTGWITTGGDEIADLCFDKYGKKTWKNGLANHMWSGHYYLLEQQYNNHSLSCVSVGP